MIEYEKTPNVKTYVIEEIVDTTIKNIEHDTSKIENEWNLTQLDASKENPID